MNTDGKTRHRLGSISERFESGRRGPGTVSGGQGDPGGVSYGTYQLASRTGTAGFSSAWKDIALREAEASASAQHAFIERTLYRPVIKAVAAGPDYDLGQRHAAACDTVWSTAVQHGGAAGLAKTAVIDAGT